MCEITGEPNGTISIRVKHATRPRTQNILLCLTWVKHSCQIRLNHGNIEKKWLCLTYINEIYTMVTFQMIEDNDRR